MVMGHYLLIIGLHSTWFFLVLSLVFCMLQPEFYQVCHTKADYDEHGPSICRHNPVFGTMA